MALKDIKFKKKFRLKDDQDNYSFMLKRKFNCWWLLLLLLFLLLFLSMFIKCSHDVIVTVVDEQGDPVEQVGVDMKYVSSYLYNADLTPAWLPAKATSRHEVTDKNGKAVFEGVGTSVFSYIFYCMDIARYSFKCHDDCIVFKENPLEKSLHFTRHVQVVAQKRRTKLRMQVIDVEDGLPIADAQVVAQWKDGSQQKNETVKSDANGFITIDNVWTCAQFDKIECKAYAYNDTTIENMPAISILSDPDHAVIKMTPIKESFTFFVKNVETKQPIPGAECTITITYRNNKNSGSVKTNVDGRGRGEYKNVPLTSTIAIDPVTATHFKPGKLDPQRTVDEFIKLPDDQRVIYLEPEPFAQQFQNVDSITGKGIKGVTNKIKISGPGGDSPDVQMSNSNGYFTISAKAGYKIEIESECEPGYDAKHTLIASYSKPEVIKMKPRLVDITFRTIDADYGDLVPNCTLKIDGTESGHHKPDTSGKGEFTVKNLRITENLSIVSSKQAYKTNDSKIKKTAVSYLADQSTPASARDIPMEIILPPCTNQSFSHKSGLLYEEVPYNLGKRRGECYFEYETGDTYADELLIYNCTPDELKKNPPKPVWDSKGAVVTNGVVRDHFTFTSPIITVVAKSDPSPGTIWNMNFDCNNIRDIP